MRLLYVEDDEDLRELTALVLDGRPDLSVTMVGSGEAALDALAAADAPFDALVIDAGLPGLSGPEVVRRLRADPGHDRMAVLFCTGRAEAAFHDDLLGAGADEVLVKPAPLDRIPERAAACLERRRAAAGE
ncbi:response regulator [Rhodovulum sp. DZ06]|uniref:response regulator n=1 Tax=Rhodovulum sp. DZ06 TaxID=3425126 RepID=UPI003D341D19